MSPTLLSPFFLFQNTIENENLDDLIAFMRDDELVADELTNEPEEINTQPSNTEITDQTCTQINPIFVADIHAVMTVHGQVDYVEDVQDVVHVVDLSVEPNDLPPENSETHGKEPQNNSLRTTNKRRNERSLDEGQKESFVQFY